MEALRNCSLCKNKITEENAVKQSNKKGGISCWCKECHRNKSRNWRLKNLQKSREMVKKWRERNPDNHRIRFLRKAYGMNKEDYDRLLKGQNGVCAICGAKESHNHHKVLCVDHIKGTFKIRGILCDRCNSAIGLLDHDPIKLKNAISYLSKKPVFEGIKFPIGVHRGQNGLTCFQVAPNNF